MLRFWALFILLLGATPAQAFVRTMSSSGTPLSWANPVVAVQANPSNSSGLTAPQVNNLLSAAFSAWSVPGTRAGFSYWQSAGVPAASGADGVNTVYFSTAGGRVMDWGVVALTEVLYYPASGQIAEADMVFNDSQFLFTANEGDTGQWIAGRTAIYLRDVATHEAGHMLGLDHSLVNLSSLIYIAFSGQYSLSPDDANAVRTMYPGAGGGASLTGTVRGTQGGIFGAHLAAINLDSGKVEAGTLANADGTFRLGDLPAGHYAVMMEPFGTDPSSVSPYYQNVDHRFCGGSRFRRRIYSACDSPGAASMLNLGAGASVALGTLAPSCAPMGNPGGAPDSLATARDLGGDGAAEWGTLHPGDTHYYVVHNVSGQLSAHVMSYSLYSPIDVRVQILDAAGGPVAGATSVDNVQNPGPGGVVNFDASATANVPAGDYVIQVSSGGARIPASKYSAGYDLLDADGHYVLALSVNGSLGPESRPDMSSCVSVSNVPQSPSFHASPSPKEDHQGTGCGSLSGGGPFFGGMMQVLLTAFGMQVLFRARRRRLALVRRRR